MLLVIFALIMAYRVRSWLRLSGDRIRRDNAFGLADCPQLNEEQCRKDAGCVWKDNKCQRKGWPRTLLLFHCVTFHFQFVVSYCYRLLLERTAVCYGRVIRNRMHISYSQACRDLSEQNCNEPCVWHKQSNTCTDGSAVYDHTLSNL